MISPQIKVLLFIAVVGGPISIGKASPISLRPSIAQGVDGGQVFLQCNTTTSAKPVLKLTQNGKVMPRSRIYLSRVQGGWFIRVGPLRAGTYTLTATSGGSASSSIIFYKAKNTTVGFPKIVRNPRYRFKKSGESVTFHCSATGSPKPQIFWTKNKVPLVADKRVTMANDGRLMFTNLQKSDQGYYECVAQNLHGMVFSRRARLYIRVVQRPPRFTVKPRDQVVDPDSDVTLNCAADGFPKPSIVWERDGSRISGVLNGVLLIKKIRRSANYSCTADSYAGKVKTYAYVTVRPLPFAPFSPVATSITPNSIAITWRPSGGHVVTSYNVAYRLKEVQKWTMISNIRGKMSLELKQLKPFSTYQFQVFAVNSLGSSKGSPLVEFTTSQTKPGSPPINITAKGKSDKSFKAEWAPPLQPNGAIRGYRLYYSTDLKLPFNQWRFMATAINHTTVSGLTTRTTYYFKIAAYNIAGTGPFSKVKAVKTHKGVPGQPTDVKLEVISSTSIRISWSKPQNPGDGIFGYEVYYNKTSKDMDVNVEASTAQTKDIMGLSPYTFYNFGVAAKSDKGIGPMSFPTAVRTKEDVPSGAPLNIVGKSRDSTTLEIKWDPPLLIHRNGRITHYYIKYKAKGEKAKYVTVDGIKTSVVLHNLKKFTNYFVWVSARTKEGEGPKSDKHVFSTAEDVPSGAPTNLKVRVRNSSCIEVTWSPPTSSQMDGKIMGYMVFYSIVDDKGNQLKPPSPEESKDSENENNLRVYLTKLAPETTYQIDVAGYTIKGDGARSVTKLAKTLPRLPDSPFVFVQQVKGSDVVLGWRTSVTDVKEYKIRYGRSLRRIRARDQSQMNPLRKTMKELPLDRSTNKYVFRGLGRGIWYLFNVSLRTKAGWSPERAKWVKIPPAKPSGPPLNVRTRSMSSTSIRITWSPPDVWLRNGDITGYMVSYSLLNQRDNPTDTTIPYTNQTRLVVRKLSKYTAYDFKVRAVNAFGNGPWSDPSAERTKEDRPGPPTNVKVQVESATVLSIDWQEPDNPNGKIKGYMVMFKSNKSLSGKWKIKKSDLLGTKLRFLSRDTRYWVKVAARTSVGFGNYSDVLTAFTLDVPGLCREFKAVQLSSNSTTIQWLPPTFESGITGYKVSFYGSKTYKLDGRDKRLTHAKDIAIPLSQQTSKLTYTIKNLNPHMSYKFSISAINKKGAGPKIDIIIKTKTDKPPKFRPPVILTKEIANGYIPLRLRNVSEINGPIRYYFVVVVPLGDKNVLPEKSPDEYFKRVKRTRRSAADHKPYIAAKFTPEYLPQKFKVGDEEFKNRYGYYNKRLRKGTYYTLFMRAYVQNEDGVSLYTSSPFTRAVSLDSPSKLGQIGAKESASRITLIIILAVAFIVVLAVVVLTVLCLLKRRRRSKKGQKEKDEEKSEPSDPVELRRQNFQTPAMMDHPPIPVIELAKHTLYLKADSGSRFTHEYDSIDTGQSFTSDASRAEVNRNKNRYPNIHAYDHSRVRLSPEEGIPGSDYINANFCDGYRKENAYIATQGPLPHTAADFWRMVWEQRTFTIVMLTREEERGRVKCDQYWPNDGTSTYDEIEVAVVDWVELANYTITTLQISKDNESQPREVKHFQFTGWPDHGVPSHPTPFLAFLRRVRFYNPPDAGPITVHCSAGVGRTACFIVIDSMLERIKHENTVDIYGHVTVLRTQRDFMVQTKEQYMFIHDALLEAVSSGNTEVHARNLLHHIKKLTELGKGEVTGLEEEFKNLIDPGQARRHKHAAATLSINRPKNRMANILPYEATRVHISPVRGVEGSDYINASFIDGYRQRGAFIATQGPLQDTVDDFWRMLMEQNSNIVVMLTKLQEGEWEKCYKYWPTERSARHQYYIVDPVAEQEYAQFVIRDFKVKDARNDTVRNIKQFHFLGWPELGVPKTGEGIIDLIGQVQRAYEQQDEDGPVTVHCSDGVGRSGVFCALFIVLERMRSEGVVDLFQTVKLLRTQRPAMVQSQEQYLFCYKTALEYLGSFDHYAI